MVASTKLPFRIKPAQNNWSSSHPVISTVLFMVGVIVLATLINTFIFQSYYVRGSSMQPTLHNDDRLVVGKTASILADLRGETYTPKRGDIVILASLVALSNNIEGSESRIVKRAVGLPGERVLIDNGTVTVYNDQHPKGFAVDETLGLASLPPTFSPAVIDVRLGADEIFVLGDNRDQGGSLDSRVFGPVKLTQVKGTLWLRILPLSDAKAF